MENGIYGIVIIGRGNSQPSTINLQPPTFNHHRSTTQHQPSTIKPIFNNSFTRQKIISMTIKDSTITNGFVIAGLMNMSVLVFSRLFTNPTIAEYDPVVMSNFGLLMIVVWGLAYISIAKTFHTVKWLVAVFAVEKFIYGFIWTSWMINNNIKDVFAKDTMAGMFYSVYGINDWLFFVFFSAVFIYLTKLKT